MKTSTKILAFALALASAPAAAQQGAPAAPAAAPSANAAPAPAAPVTPANDPAYTYKTLRLNRFAFDALLAKPEQLLVLDVRRPDELTKIGGFPVYLSIQAADVQRNLSFIPHDRLIVVVSNRAHRAGATGDILAGLGYHVVGAIGVLDYQDEGGVLTKIAPPPPRNAAAGPAPEGQPQTAAAAASPAPAKP
ncbi:MAG TPA: rhodanese-like domain-containing protein [Methylocystis sp.]|nr:rhodanese-like domain-containing protein [Methylocystis sp.]